MVESVLLTVDGLRAEPVDRTTLAEQNLLERRHLQEWVLAHPEMLGEPLLIVSSEFDRFSTATGDNTWERLDILALDRSGRLVVAELKRAKAPDSIVVQALNYAAMVSRFSLDLLIEAYGAFHRRELSPEEMLDELREWAPGVSDETLGPARIVLVAEDYGPVITNTSMFLIEQGLDLRLVKIQLFRLDTGQLVVSTSQVLPVPNAEDFMVRPRSSAPTQRATREAALQRSSITERLVAAGAFSEGEELQVIVRNVGQNRDAINAWLEAAPERRIVHWHEDGNKPLRWAVDGQLWNLTSLARHIIEQATGDAPPTQVWGPNWFATLDGEVIYKVAQRLEAEAGMQAAEPGG